METTKHIAETDEGTWTLGPRFMLRVAGLPASAVDGLRCPESLEWAEGLLAEEARVRADAAELSELLGRAIGGLEDATRRQALIRLRRGIFNDRLPADTSAVRDLVESLDPDVRDRVLAWLTDRLRLEELTTSGAEILG